MKHTLGAIVALLFITHVTAQYKPTWESLDSRPIPKWYDQSKFGIFIHWGVFSVPSYGCTGGGASGEWYWWHLDGNKDPCTVAFHDRVYGKDFTYPDFAPMFKAELFNATEWASIFSASGAKYVVLTSKHHEGFCNWPSPQAWNWNSVDTGPHQDSVGLLTDAVRKTGLHMGLYHSLFEWFNPLYLADKANKGNTTVYVDTILSPQLHDIVMKYKPELIWADGDWEMSDTYWKSKEFLAWLYNESPVKDSIVVNDRWGKDDNCKHGGYWTCKDRYNPGKIVEHKWENAMTIDSSSWGYNRNSALDMYLSVDELLNELVTTVAYGGNLLLNVGPTADGRILPVFEERLRQMGAWLKINGEAIYETKPWRAQNQTDDELFYTSTSDAVYAITFKWPTKNLVLSAPICSTDSKVMLLGYGSVSSTCSGGLTITMPDETLLKSDMTHAWVFKLMGIK
mmetsp:Transcript_24407/g.27146  ORF Transcript_24407/g.27146 Transcript_24407/m.27146 type:complete len:453 (-) Transcript_24407:45-1403(-)